MKIVEAFLTKNPCYKTNKKIKPSGIMLHTAGCPQSSAKVFINNWNQATFERACVHAFVDANDGSVYQTLPWNHRGRHAGGNANGTHIGIMMCEPSKLKYDKKTNEITVLDLESCLKGAKRAYESAVEVVAQLCIQNNLYPMKDICSSIEGKVNGISDGSDDPEKLWKALELPYTMDGFRKDVSKEVDKVLDKAIDKVSLPTSQIIEEPKEVVEQLIAEPVSESPKPKQVQVFVDNLRIRTGPGTEFGTTGSYTGKGVFNYTEIQNGTGSPVGWAKLANGMGWICILPDYVKILG